MISCFETVELRDGLYFELDAHLFALENRSGHSLGLPPLDEPQLSRALELARSHPPEPEGVDSLRRVRVQQIGTIVANPSWSPRQCLFTLHRPLSSWTPNLDC